MNYTFILGRILSVFRECEVNSFPLDCVGLINKYGYRVFTYQELKSKSPELYEMCITCSDDTFRDMATKTVAYNTEALKRRVYFSLAHELGHIVLGHLAETPKTEAEANFFASNLLAPRMAIHYSNCKNEADVARIFEVSCEAAQYAFDDYRRWRRYIVSRHNRMTALDRAMYYHFYDDNYKRFVYCRKECRHCGKEYVNSEWRICEKCKRIAEIRGNMHDSYEADINMLNKWIYNMNKKQEIL